MKTNKKRVKNLTYTGEDKHIRDYLRLYSEKHISGKQGTPRGVRDSRKYKTIKLEKMKNLDNLRKYYNLEKLYCTRTQSY